MALTLFHEKIKNANLKIAATIDDATKPIDTRDGVVAGGQGSDHATNRAKKLANELGKDVLDQKQELDDYIDQLLKQD